MDEKPWKNSIDAMSVSKLLAEVRFAPVGDPKFQGEQGAYRLARLKELRDKDPDAYVRASKDIGW